MIDFRKCIIENNFIDVLIINYTYTSGYGWHPEQWRSYRGGGINDNGDSPHPKKKLLDPWWSDECIVLRMFFKLYFAYVYRFYYFIRFLTFRLASDRKFNLNFEPLRGKN